MRDGPTRIVALGECMVELREDPAGRMFFGFAGDTLNVATYLRRLLPQPAYRVDYLTALGDDPLSERMLSAWRGEGIGTDLVHRLTGELPGLYWIHNEPDGERSFFYWRSAAAARLVFRDGHGVLARALQSGDLLYLSGISLAILPDDQRDGLVDVVARLRANGVRVAFDSNYRTRLWRSIAEARRVHDRMLANADLVFTTAQDEAALFGVGSTAQAVQRLRSHGVPEWIVRGGPGITITSDGVEAVASVDAGNVIDTTGAGDSFDAAYISARLSGAEVPAAVRAGHALARVVVRHRGAIVPILATPPLEALLDG